MKTFLLTLCLLLLFAASQALTLRLEWGPPLSGVPHAYIMYRQEGGSGLFEVLAHVPAPTTTYTDTTAPAGVSCYYATAYNAAGESVPSNTACFPGLEERPGPPVALRLVP